LWISSRPPISQFLLKKSPAFMCLKEEPIFIQVQMHVSNRPCKWARANEDSSFLSLSGLGTSLCGSSFLASFTRCCKGSIEKKISTFRKIFAKNNNKKKLPSILTPSLNPRKEVGLKGSQLWHISQQILILYKILDPWVQ
jgi:hypothetical protein